MNPVVGANVRARARAEAEAKAVAQLDQTKQVAAGVVFLLTAT